MRPGTARFTERMFERWLLAHPILPDGRQLLFLRQSRDLRREADLLALDGEGTLLLFEVKNEPSTRGLCAQVLDYLSGLEGATLADLEELAGGAPGELARRFESTFHAVLKDPGPRREVHLCARWFDGTTALLKEFVDRRIQNARLVMWEIARGESGFEMTECRMSMVAPATLEPLEFCLRRKGRISTIYFLLTRRPGPVLVRVGTIDERAGRIDVGNPGASSYRTETPWVVRHTPREIDTQCAGRALRRRGRTVVLVAESGPWALALLFEGLRFRGVKKYRKEKLDRWEPCDAEPFDWRKVLEDFAKGLRR